MFNEQYQSDFFQELFQFLYFVKHIPLDDEKYGLSYRLNSDLTEEKIVYPHHPPYVSLQTVQSSKMLG